MEVKKILLVSLLVIFSLLALSFIFTKKTDIITEISKLNPDENTIVAISSSDCKTLEKNEKVWIIKDCKDGRYFKLFLTEDGYILGECVKWENPREAFIKLRDILPIKECINVSAEDRLLRETNFSKTYEVCGLKIMFVDECIVGVRL
jgi:uncharacterized radical SAM superfamily Fe-S cluster-containing enzyme